MTCLAVEAATESLQPSGFVNQCAWCGAMGLGGTYDTVRRPIIAKVGRRHVSHGICPSCFDSVLARRPKAL